MKLQPLDPDNWKECVRLSVGEEQKDFVSSNLYAIAEAGIEGYEPHALYDGDTMVGMVVLAKLSGGTGMVHHVMVDRRFQRRGYGRAAMEEIIRAARESHRRLVLRYWPPNPAAKLYESLGFSHTGEEWNGEPVMELLL